MSERYVAFGEHRSGSPADRDTAAWLGRELELAGYRLDFLDFELDLPMVRQCRLELPGGEVAEMFPTWPVASAERLRIAAPMARWRPGNGGVPGCLAVTPARCCSSRSLVRWPA